jgi:serine/threonine protein kinase
MVCRAEQYAFKQERYRNFLELISITHWAPVLQETRHQMLNDLKALCDAPNNVPGLVSFYGAYHVPESGQISIVLEYVDGGSLADVQAKVCAAFGRELGA